MEELSVLRQYIEQGRYGDALLFIDELEEMSKEDKLNKIFSYALVLLIHLIKKHAEQRTTRSWDFSIDHAVLQIKRTNRRRKAGGAYASPAELKEVLEEAFDLALKKAALEVFEGGLDEAEMATKVDKIAIVEEALAKLIEKGGTDGCSPDPIPNSEVKPSNADDTTRVTAWESRTPPDLFSVTVHTKFAF